MKNVFFTFFSILLCFSFFSQKTSIISGSGVVLTKEGYIATNNHIVENGIEFYVDVYSNGRMQSFKANVIKTDDENDLAVLKIEDPSFKSFSEVPFAFKMQGINVGEKVFAMGYPRPGIQGEEVKVTDGIISSKTGYQNDNKTYQISAPIQPGNSGGPLFDYSGNLIGLTSSGIPSGENVGYAIKISYLNNMLDLIPDLPSLQSSTSITSMSLTDKVKVLSNYTVMIRVVILDCDLETPSVLFSQVNTGYSLKDISNLLGGEGDNYRNDGTGISYYKWIYCGDDKTYIDCWFQNENLFLSLKSFNNPSLRYNLNDETFKLIKTGMSYESVCDLLKGKGDQYRTDYMANIRYYRWIDDYNQDIYFEIWFLNNHVHLSRKGDFSKEKSIFGE